MPGDHRKTPAAGVRVPTAQPRAKSEAGWESADSLTPMGSEPLEEIVQRSRKTQKETREGLVVSQNTLTSVNSVRAEMRDKVQKLDDKVERLDGKVEEVSVHVGNLRETMGEVVGELRGITITLQEDREERRNHAMMKFSAFQAEMEVTKTEKLADVEVEKTAKVIGIKDGAAIREHRRKLVYKILTILATAGTLISTAIAAGRC